MSPPSVRWKVWLLAVLSLGVLSLGQGKAVHAESGGVADLPQGTAKPKHKVRITVDTRWVDSNGYRPIRVTVSQWPFGKAPADRQFRITLSADDFSGRAETAVTDVIDLPEGQAFATKAIPFPQYSQNWRYHLRVREDGVELPQFETDLTFPNRYGYGNWTESNPAMLFLDVDAPSFDRQQAMVEKQRRSPMSFPPDEPITLSDMRNVSQIFPDPTRGTAFEYVDEKTGRSDSLILNSFIETPRHLMTSPREMPTRWIEWTCFDIAFISLDDLARMARQDEQPAQFAALNDWLRAGGTLFVHGTGENFARVKELEALLKLSEEPTSGKALLTTAQNRLNASDFDLAIGETTQVNSPGWQPPRKSDFGRGLAAQNEIANNNAAYPAGTTLKKSLPVDPAKATAVVTKEPPYLVRDVSFGKLVVFAKDNPLPGKIEDWQAVLNTVGAGHWMWYRRHGMSMTRDNDAYWQFLIPGVGKAPVMTFLVLITLFMAAIGPINYSWLKRRGRLHLLLVTVPAGAAIMVVGLFLFAVFTDGLSVRSRIRSFTRLDPQNQRAASWSRQTYYASLPPSRGLIFPDSAAIYPLEAEPVSRGGRRAGGRVVEWDDAQRLKTGYLFPRTAAQYLVINNEPCQARLEVKATGKELSAENHLGSAIALLVLRDEQGAYFIASDVAEGTAKPLQPEKPMDAFDRWAKFVRQDRPELPTDWTVSQDNLFSWIGGRRYNYWNIDGQASPTTQATSLLEQGLTDGDPSKFDVRLPPRGYLAAVAEPVATPIGLKNAKAKASLHVVQGTW